MLHTRKNSYHKFVHGLLVAAFLLMGISPACKFVAGDAFAMEICKPDGTVIVMVMNEDGTLTETEKTDTRHAESDCGFCFASQNIKILAAASLKPSLAGLEGQTGLFVTTAVIARQSANHLYAPRGPPVLSV